MSNDALEQFNQTIDTWIRVVDEYPFDVLIERPIPRSWSLGQVIVHIIKETTWQIEQIQSAIADNSNSEKKMHPDAEWMFRNNMFPDMQIEGVATVDNVPQPVSKEALYQQLTAIRQTINTFYNSPGFAALRGKSEHPGLWFFSAADWIRFSELHMRHHLRQKKRIEDALKNG